MTEEGAATKNPIRGAIKLEVSTSEPVVTASSGFSIFVVIRNPFDVPITVYAVETHIPIELADLVWLQRQTLAARASAAQRIAETSGFARLATRVLESTKQLLSVGTKGSPPIAQAVGAEEELAVASGIQSVINVGNVRDSTVTGVQFDMHFPENPTNEDLDRLLMKLQDIKSGKAPTVLEAGNAVVKHFVLRAKHWLFFSPLAYTFQIQVKYAVDGRENIDTIPFALQIRAALKATIVGAVVGGLLGAIARSLGANGQVLAPGVLLLSGIFGAIAVVAFARKSAAQQIVSVEDFWGGLLIGFLVGYLGEAYFRQIIGG